MKKYQWLPFGERKMLCMKWNEKAFSFGLLFGFVLVKSFCIGNARTSKTPWQTSIKQSLVFVCVFFSSVALFCFAKRMLHYFSAFCLHPSQNSSLYILCLQFVGMFSFRCLFVCLCIQSIRHVGFLLVMRCFTDCWVL